MLQTEQRSKDHRQFLTGNSASETRVRSTSELPEETSVAQKTRQNQVKITTLSAIL